MKMEWNDKQKLAINSKNGTVLVSAAAGSGKSAVLVERVIQRICDEKNKCPADSLMIVTFTRAAASELRHKISTALSKAIADADDKTYLLKQQRLLSSAVIGTMDSFCGQLVRDNFFLADIEPDFRILDATEESLLEKDAVEAVLEEEYEKGEPAFIDLLELFGSDRDDRNLINNIIQCYSFSIAYPFPEKWIDSITDEFKEGLSPSQSASGKVLLDYVKLNTECALMYFKKALSNVEDIEELKDSYISLFNSNIAYCENILALADNGQWDSLLVALNDSKKQLGNMPTINKEIRNLPEVDEAFNIRNTAKKKIVSLVGTLPVIELQHADDLKALSPVLEKFIFLVKAFSVELMRLKREENAYSFSDISSIALKLLVDENGNKTVLANELSEKFTEILIDEFQDTNRAQEMFFNALSKDGKNLFIVGDVKQSIYRFRKAMPDIFIERRDEYDYYDPNKDNYPSKIFLDYNYRSRKAVLDSVNYVFKMLMSKRTGDIDYNKDEYLNYGASFSGADTPTEIHFLHRTSENKKSDEGEHIAKEIKKLIDSKFQVKDGEKTRDIRYSDICILLRSVKNNKGGKIEAALIKNGIPAFCDAASDFCDSTEISTILSLLRFIDNPLNDLALLSVLFSPIYGFTPDELAEIRLESKKARLYTCLKKYAEKSVKAKKFIDEINEFRHLSVVCTADEMLRKIYSVTNYDEIVLAMPNGEKRSRNLLHLLDFAEKFVSSGLFGLSDFIRFIDKVTRNGGDIANESVSSDRGNCVEITTIHKSKGLEYPVVFIANCNRGVVINEKNSSNVLLNPTTKLGVKRQDRKKLFRYSTVSYKGTKIKNDLEDIAEELRILYVAMTRAREKLYFVIANSLSKASINLYDIAMQVSINGSLHPADLIDDDNVAKWILACAFLSSSCENLRNTYGCSIPSSYVEKTDFISFKEFSEESEEQEAEERECEKISADAEFIKEIDSRINYEYPFLPLTKVASKRTASGFSEQESDYSYFASSKPAFMLKDSYTPAQKGTLAHLFMEKCDFVNAENSVENELERLKKNGIFNEKQAAAVNTGKLSEFFSGSLYSRMKSSSKLFREQKFTVSLPVSFFEKDVESEDNVVVQGKIDCFFIENAEAVIVDYKTDYVKDGKELCERYAPQMEVYKKAVEDFTGKKVKEVILYSFSLGKEISCPLKSIN